MIRSMIIFGIPLGASATVGGLGHAAERPVRSWAARGVSGTDRGAVPRYKRYLDEMPGVPVQDIWDGINAMAQKPWR